jgi:hypothetical protein
MSVKLAKGYDFITLIVSTEFVNLESKLKIVVSSQEKISVRDTKNNSVIHFAVDIINLLQSKRTAIKDADRNDENPQSI